MPPLQNRIVDLTDKIGVGYFAFDSHILLSPYQKEKNYPETPTPLITRRGRATTKNLYLSPEDTITLFGGLTEGINGSKLYHNLSCMKTKHPSAVTISLLPLHS